MTTARRWLAKLAGPAVRLFRHEAFRFYWMLLGLAVAVYVVAWVLTHLAKLVVGDLN